MNAIRTIGMIGTICGVMVTALMAWLEISAGRGINAFVWGFGLYTVLIAAVWYLGERLFAPTRDSVTRD
jgi:hypothetical protein